jgi:twitching motility protein PilI
MADSTKNPILLLQALEQRCKESAFSLPQQLEIKHTWDGVGFRIGDAQLVAPLADIREVLIQAQVTPVPGALEWVKGIANVRGNLLPIMDLQGLLLGKPIPHSRHSRILVVQHKGVSAGLLVDEVFGLRHFLEEEMETEKANIAEGIAKWTEVRFRQAGQEWGIFHLHKLVDAPEFMSVAA